MAEKGFALCSLVSVCGSWEVSQKIVGYCFPFQKALCATDRFFCFLVREYWKRHPACVALTCAGLAEAFSQVCAGSGCIAHGAGVAAATWCTVFHPERPCVGFFDKVLQMGVDALDTRRYLAACVRDGFLEGKGLALSELLDGPKLKRLICWLEQDAALRSKVNAFVEKHKNMVQISLIKHGDDINNYVFYDPPFVLPKTHLNSVIKIGCFKSVKRMVLEHGVAASTLVSRAVRHGSEVFVRKLAVFLNNRHKRRFYGLHFEGDLYGPEGYDFRPQVYSGDTSFLRKVVKLGLTVNSAVKRDAFCYGDEATRKILQVDEETVAFFRNAAEAPGPSGRGLQEETASEYKERLRRCAGCDVLKLVVENDDVEKMKLLYVSGQNMHFAVLRSAASQAVGCAKMLISRMVQLKHSECKRAFTRIMLMDTCEEIGWIALRAFETVRWCSMAEEQRLLKSLILLGRLHFVRHLYWDRWHLAFSSDDALLEFVLKKMGKTCPIYAVRRRYYDHLFFCMLQEQQVTLPARFSERHLCLLESGSVMQQLEPWIAQHRTAQQLLCLLADCVASAKYEVALRVLALLDARSCPCPVHPDAHRHAQEAAQLSDKNALDCFVKAILRKGNHAAFLSLKKHVRITLDERTLLLLFESVFRSGCLHCSSETKEALHCGLRAARDLCVASKQSLYRKMAISVREHCARPKNLARLGPNGFIETVFVNQCFLRDYNWLVHMLNEEWASVDPLWSQQGTGALSDRILHGLAAGTTAALLSRTSDNPLTAKRPFCSLNEENRGRPQKRAAKNADVTNCAGGKAP